MLNIDGGLVVANFPKPDQILAAVQIAEANQTTGTVNINNGGELQTTGISFSSPTGGRERREQVWLLNAKRW
jgi:hypothetical protein